MVGSQKPGKKALDWNPQGKRSRRRPRGSWRRVMKEHIKRSGKAWNATKKLVQDRKIRKEFVGGPYPRQG